MIGVGCGFESAGGIGDCQPEQERDGKFHPIVLVKLQLWQQVAQRDAKKCAGREGQGVGHEQLSAAARTVDG